MKHVYRSPAKSRKPNEAMSDVFVAFVREDQAIAEAIAIALENSGLGVSRSASVMEAIDASPAVVVLWTPASARSRLFLDAADRAFSAGKMVLVCCRASPALTKYNTALMHTLQSLSSNPAQRELTAVIGDVHRLVKLNRNPVKRAAMPTSSGAPSAGGFLFISHASAADGATANALVAALEAAGQPCWIAPRDIPAGADWNGAILGAIEACAGVVLLVSEASVASRFVQAEIQHAFDWKKKVVPVRLAEAEPARLDLRLETVQQVRMGGDLVIVTRDLRTAFV